GEADLAREEREVVRIVPSRDRQCVLEHGGDGRAGDGTARPVGGGRGGRHRVPRHDHTAREGPIAAADTIDYETTQTSVSHGRRTPPRVTDEEAHTSGRGRAASRPAMHLAVYTFQNLCLDSRHPRPPRRSGTPPIDGGRRHRPKEVTDAHAPHPGHRLAAA